MRETGKQRTARIPLDYFKQSESLSTWKLRLTLAAILLAVAWWASGWLHGGDTARMRFAPAPTSHAHAAWESSCTTCHVPANPLNSRSWLASFSRNARSSDRLCQTCHLGPAHHANEKTADVPSCAACHPEHRGRDASLTRLPNALCVQCHADLDQHTLGAPPRFARTVTDFNIDHPEFKTPHEDPGRLHFNHARHMTAGMAMVRSDGSSPADAVAVWRYRDIKDESERIRYWNQRYPDSSTIPPDALDRPVQLNCASCHVLDAADLRSPAAQPATIESTKVMQPIQYDRHCQACHPLTFESDGPRSSVPHGLQVTEVRTLLDGIFVRRFLDGKPVDESPRPQTRPMPGRAVSDDAQAARNIIDPQIAQAEAYLIQSMAGCKRCHGDPGEPLEIVQPTNVTQVWFKHAVFDHAAHRAMDCNLCHTAVARSTSERDVLLPAIQLCRDCHAPAVRAWGKASGGARHDCTECHLYHNGDAHQGVGAAARHGSMKATTPATFLQATPPEGHEVK